ncbi:hypothetical protein EVAR_2960_1 [Eumeta japonica]|uniref:Uncharacterized protein n=1 Tax=Eumeta variegata TaxID=151549 RepID=A0A4C1T3N1_EUMVA|nr:hypothetical protein EVAR_2960_1 [Eumeta japonica]
MRTTHETQPSRVPLSAPLGQLTRRSHSLDPLEAKKKREKFLNFQRKEIALLDHGNEKLIGTLVNGLSNATGRRSDLAKFQLVRFARRFYNVSASRYNSRECHLASDVGKKRAAADRSVEWERRKALASSRLGQFITFLGRELGIHRSLKTLKGGTGYHKFEKPRNKPICKRLVTPSCVRQLDNVKAAQCGANIDMSYQEPRLVGAVRRTRKSLLFVLNNNPTASRATTLAYQSDPERRPRSICIRTTYFLS